MATEHRTAQECEAYVWARWERVLYSEGGLTQDGPFYVVISAEDHPTAGSTIFMKHGGSRGSVFQAAYDYTVERERQIAKRKYAISLLKRCHGQGDWGDDWKPIDWAQDQGALTEVIEREQAALADLQRGLREPAQGKDAE